MRMQSTLLLSLLAILAIISGCSVGASAPPTPTHWLIASEVESLFRGYAQSVPSPNPGRWDSCWDYADYSQRGETVRASPKSTDVMRHQQLIAQVTDGREHTLETVPGTWTLKAKGYLSLDFWEFRESTRIFTGPC